MTFKIITLLWGTGTLPGVTVGAYHGVTEGVQHLAPGDLSSALKVSWHLALEPFSYFTLLSYHQLSL